MLPFYALLLFLALSGVHAGLNERLDDVPQLSGQGPLQVVANGADHVLWRPVAGTSLFGCKSKFQTLHLGMSSRTYLLTYRNAFISCRQKLSFLCGLVRHFFLSGHLQALSWRTNIAVSTITEHASITFSFSVDRSRQSTMVSPSSKTRWSFRSMGICCG